MKTLDLGPTRGPERSPDLGGRREDASVAFDGALRDANAAADARAEVDGPPQRDERAGEASPETTLPLEAAESDLATGDDDPSVAETHDQALAPDERAATDAASLALAVASAASPCAAPALPLPERCAAGAQGRAKPGIRGEGTRASDAAGALTQAAGEPGQPGGGGDAREGAASPPRAGAAAPNAGAARLADHARGDASAREELGVARLAEVREDAAPAHGEVPATGSAPGTGAPPVDRGAPPLDITALRLPAAAAEASAPEPLRAVAATPHGASEAGADGAVLRNAAHLRVASPGLGDIELHLRVLDGVAHLRVDGDAARVVESRAAELSRALAGEGLKLGQLDTRPAHSPSFAGADDSTPRHDQQHPGSGNPRDEPSPRAPRQPAPRSSPAPAQPASTGGYAVRA